MPVNSFCLWFFKAHFTNAWHNWFWFGGVFFIAYRYIQADSLTIHDFAFCISIVQKLKSEWQAIYERCLRSALFDIGPYTFCRFILLEKQYGAMMNISMRWTAFKMGKKTWQLNKSHHMHKYLYLPNSSSTFIEFGWKTFSTYFGQKPLTQN